MPELVFASANLNKIKEIKSLLPDNWNIISALEAGISEDIPETGNTLNENAFLKANYIFQKTHKDCFADDTGLEVEALDNAPGVYSARFAGPEKNDQKNIQFLLEKLAHKSSRKARFRTVLCLCLKGEFFYFEGIAEGEIAMNPIGNQGFGYDPVFIPQGYNQTFAQMTLDEKNKVSHRKRAFYKLNEFLKSRNER